MGFSISLNSGNGIVRAVLGYIIGIVFIGAGYFAITTSSIDESWIRINGTVSDIETSERLRSDSTNRYDEVHAPIVSYTVDEQQYSVTSSTASSSLPVIGEAKEIAYNPADPADSKVVQSSTQQALLWLFPVLGLVSIIAATFMLKRR